MAGEEKDFCAFLVVINHFPELGGGLERIASSIGAGGLLAKRRIWPFISSTSRRRLPSSGEGPLTSRFSAFNAETRAEAAERWHTDVVDCACDKELYWRPTAENLRIGGLSGGYCSPLQTLLWAKKISESSAPR